MQARRQSGKHGGKPKGKEARGKPEDQETSKSAKRRARWQIGKETEASTDARR